MIHPDSAAAWLIRIINDFMINSPENTLQNAVNEPAFEQPLVGFSRGDDPIYEAYKEYVGPRHWTPQEVFTLAFPDVQIAPEDVTVISWILPQTKATKADNRRQRKYPAERWVRARIFGEQTNSALRRHVIDVLQEAGYEAVAPLLLPECTGDFTGDYTYEGAWSERHAAYASGLGTFGLCDGLITSKGKAMRTGSVVARIQVPPTPRPYTQHQEYCLFFVDQSCRKCADRCPVGAITEKGHNKSICHNYLFPITENFVKAHYHFDGYGCGLCQTAVPCESGIPTRKDG